jgi:hypothetical protein
MNVYVNGSQPDDEWLVDDDGSRYTIEQARALWESGAIRDYNLALHRLATRCGWSFAELRRQYAEMDSARGK